MPTPAELPLIVQRVLAAQPIVDMHTHLYPPNFGHAGPDGLMLWGLDDLSATSLRDRVRASSAS